MQQKVLDTGEAVHGLEVSGETAAQPGKTRHWLVDYYPLRRDGGEVFAIGACVAEVTEQVELQREVRESEAKLRRLFDNAPAYIAVYGGADHVFTYVNPSMRRIVGNRDLLGKPLREALPELTGGAAERFDEAYREAKRIITPELEASFIREPGSEPETGWFTEVVEPWYEADGSVGGVMNFTYDITDQVRAREAGDDGARSLVARRVRPRDARGEVFDLDRLSVAGSPRASLYGWIALAAALGGMLRYSLAVAGQQSGVDGWPWATLAANVAGCAAIGLYWRLTRPGGRFPASAERRSAFMTGFCGGLTTFSAFGVETWSFVLDGDIASAVAYPVVTLAVSLAAVAATVLPGNRLS